MVRIEILLTVPFFSLFGGNLTSVLQSNHPKKHTTVYSTFMVRTFSCLKRSFSIKIFSFLT